MQYEFHRGETIVIAIDVLSGDDTSVSSIVAKMKPTKLGKLSVNESAAVSATFFVSARPASGDIPKGWDLIVESSVSATLPVGVYAVDVALQVAGSVVVTDPVFINLRESVSV